MCSHTEATFSAQTLRGLALDLENARQDFGIGQVSVCKTFRVAADALDAKDEKIRLQTKLYDAQAAQIAELERTLASIENQADELAERISSALQIADRGSCKRLDAGDMVAADCYRRCSVGRRLRPPSWQPNPACSTTSALVYVQHERSPNSTRLLRRVCDQRDRQNGNALPGLSVL